MAISQNQRNRIAERAGRRCEYCLLHENVSAKHHEPDHIVPRKHSGSDNDDNLAWACFHCNRHKASEVGAFDIETSQLVPLFNPRRQVWAEHLALDGGEIIPLKAIGRVTVLVLQLNRPARIEVRALRREVRLYPKKLSYTRIPLCSKCTKIAANCSGAQ